MKHIKGHFKIEREKISSLIERLNELEHSSNHTIKKYHNFYVYRCDFIFVIFPISAFVNIINLKSFSDIDKAFETFCDIFHFSRIHLQNSFKIDNITASGSFNNNIDLHKIRTLIKSPNSTSYKPEYFPGCFIKIFSLGSLILFRNGSYSIVGAKCQNHVDQIFQKVMTILTEI